MPTHTSTNNQIRQLYINWYFCYTYKIGIVANSPSTVRHLVFYNKAFLESHPKLIPNRKSDSHDDGKSIHDVRLLVPTLQDFIKAHPLIHPKTSPRDAAFDSAAIYEHLLSGDTFGKNNHFSKAFISLNKRLKLKNPDYTINSSSIPYCPK